MEALTGNPCLLDSEHVMFVIFQLPQPNAAQKFLYGNFLNLCKTLCTVVVLEVVACTGCPLSTTMGQSFGRHINGRFLRIFNLPS